MIDVILNAIIISFGALLILISQNKENFILRSILLALGILLIRIC